MELYEQPRDRYAPRLPVDLARPNDLCPFARLRYIGNCPGEDRFRENLQIERLAKVRMLPQSLHFVFSCR